MNGDNVVEFEARNRLRMIVNRTAELRPLKSVSAKAISMAEDERSAAMDLAAVISSDQALTARLLRLSNSAYYGYARRISNVREAVILLGMRTVRSVAITSGIIDSFRESEPGDFDMDLFWAHSVTVGIVAETIAKDTRLARPEDAFTAGVMHDVGKLAMFLCEPDAMKEVTGRVVTDGMRWHDAELAVFGLTHELIGARLAQKWKFPDLLVDAIQQHHTSGRGAAVDSLADIVRLANLACNKQGLAAGLDWTREPERRPIEAIPPRVEEAIKRVHGGMATLEEKGRAFLAHVTSRPPRWYLGPQVLVEAAEPAAQTNAA
ncbi:MAG: HDOD domain-containing protein [Dehalococcoidia bacterium]|nr:HDOD domain-containing protein [Dehalococcoidia bacterium]